MGDTATGGMGDTVTGGMGDTITGATIGFLRMERKKKKVT